MPKRSAYWDVARGLAMLVVIFAHAIGYLDGISFRHPMHWVISTFQMVLFFVISGAVTALGHERGFWRTIGRKAWTLLTPYVVWLVIWQFVFSYETSFWAMLFQGGLWFLRILFYVFVLHAASRKIALWVVRSKTGAVRHAIQAIVVLFCTVVAWGLAHGWLVSASVGEHAFRQLGYFFLWFEIGHGVVKGCGAIEWRLPVREAFKRRFWGWLDVFLAGGAFVGLIPMLVADGCQMCRWAIPPMAFAGSIVMLWLARAVTNARQNWWFRRVCSFTGRESLQFYAVHCLIATWLAEYWPIGLDSPLRLTTSFKAFFAGEWVSCVVLFVALWALSAVVVRGIAALRFAINQSAAASGKR